MKQVISETLFLANILASYWRNQTECNKSKQNEQNEMAKYTKSKPKSKENLNVKQHQQSYLRTAHTSVCTTV